MLHPASKSRAAEAAARVAARYAHAPSFSQALAEAEQSSAPVAEAAPQASIEAIAAEPLPSTEAALSAEPVLSFEAAPAFEPILFSEPVQPLQAPVQQLQAASLPPVEAEPLRANLLVFPRELVAQRKLRPRRADGGAAEAYQSAAQLSIFEVDPTSIALPAAIHASAGQATTAQLPQWSEIELDAHPLDEEEFESALEPDAPVLYPAPLSLRLMASLVDSALVGGAVCGAAAVAAARMSSLPGIKTLEVAAVAALLLAAVLYQMLFFTLGEATPGMKYAKLSLCTFDGEVPTRAQLRGRLGALLLSMLPLGLGAAWALFDEDRLGWHDRLSRTYQRQC